MPGWWNLSIAEGDQSQQGGDLRKYLSRADDITGDAADGAPYQPSNR